MTSSIAVLKFGSSVLRSAKDLPLAVREVDRERRAGRRVIAVVSAYAGMTDLLFEQARALGDDLHAQAAYVAKGEEESGAQLASALLAAGIAARYVDPDEAGLCADGDPHDATPTALHVTRLARRLKEQPALVLPGFIARDPQGRCVLLGRGGSDLTALFVAQRLGARCRLLKDVDGVYERDPAAGGARRYRQLSWYTALRIGGRVIQPRAVLFAESHGQTFEVTAVGAARGTAVGPGPDVLETLTDPQRSGDPSSRGCTAHPQSA